MIQPCTVSPHVLNKLCSLKINFFFNQLYFIHKSSTIGDPDDDSEDSDYGFNWFFPALEMTEVEEKPNFNEHPKELERKDVAKVSIKMPPFFRKNAKVWFWQIESQFANTGITNELTKYHYVVGSLDADIADLVADFMERPLSATPYADLKKRLLSEFEETEGRKAKKLLTEIQLGDKKPSQLLREMKKLAGSNVKDEFLRTIFLDRLPDSCKSILAASQSETLDNLASMADRILEHLPSSSLVSSQYICATTRSHTHRPPDLEQRVASLEQSLSTITESLAKLNRQMSQRARSRSKSPYPRSGSQSRNGNYDMCWYHFKFGEAAKQCVQPCKFSSKDPTKQENL